MRRRCWNCRPIARARRCRHGLARKSVSTLSAELTARLRRVSRAEGVTLFMTLLAGFKALLSRYSGQHDVSVGAPIAGRRHVELEGLIGFFANTLVLRTDLSGNPSVRDLLHRVRHVVLEADAHQDVPFEKLVEELAPARSLSYSPLFQVMFAFRSMTGETVRVGDLEIASMTSETLTAKFDMTLEIVEHADHLSGAIEYNTDLFDAATVARMAGHLRTAAGRDRGGSGGAAVAGAADGGGRTAAGAGGLERDGAAYAAGHAARAGGSAGGADAGGRPR